MDGVRKADPAAPPAAEITAPARPAAANNRSRWYRLRHPSLAARLVLLALVFVAVPTALVGPFMATEEAKRQALLRAVRTQGAVIAEGLRLALEKSQDADLPTAREALERLAQPDMRLRLLFRPEEQESVFLIGAQPPLPAEQLDTERLALVAAGVPWTLPESCRGGQPLDLPYVTPGGEQEVLTSLTPFTTETGCWGLLTSYSLSGLIGEQLARPTWRSQQVLYAAGLYGLAALLALGVIWALWRSLRRFARQARAVAQGEAPAERAFRASARIPELQDVAKDFDGMVERLRASADAIRHAAEENAHAFKTPLATIAQSLEPLYRKVPEGDSRTRRSLDTARAALTRLEALVQAARRVDAAMADLIDPPRRRIDISVLVLAVAESFDDPEEGVSVTADVQPNLHVLGGEDLLETVAENIIENAVSFNPPGATVRAVLRREGKQVVFTVEDEGPGVDPAVLPNVFERYVSHRPERPERPGAGHFGLGLWIVKRNVQAMGGSVTAENRTPRGCRMTVRLPFAK